MGMREKIFGAFAAGMIAGSAAEAGEPPQPAAPITQNKEAGVHTPEIKDALALKVIQLLNGFPYLKVEAKPGSKKSGSRERKWVTIKIYHKDGEGELMELTIDGDQPDPKYQIQGELFAPGKLRTKYKEPVVGLTMQGVQILAEQAAPFLKNCGDKLAKAETGTLVDSSGKILTVRDVESEFRGGIEAIIQAAEAAKQ